MRRPINNRWFALTVLLFAMMSAAAWMLIPRMAVWFTLLALLPWILMLSGGTLHYRRTPFDLLLLIFLVTAWIGYWAAYDKSSAWIKVWLLVSAVLFYYGLSAQPRQNLGLLSFLSFCFAATIAIYFFLTYDFSAMQSGVATWWMAFRPQVDWPALHHGNSSGLLLISSIFSLYWLWSLRRTAVGAVSIAQKILLISVIGLIFLTFLLAISHGIELMIIAVMGLGLLWKVSNSSKSIAGEKIVFPILVLAYLSVVIILVYIGPAKEPAGQAPNDYGVNSRSELLERGVYFLIDYPITGAGLNSFAGLYSQYMIVIPFFYFGNSYNLLLDVASEQSLLGGAVLLIIYLGAIWLVSRRIITAVSTDSRVVNWISLLALLVMMVYGLFYDNLYQGDGTALLFYPLGMAMIGVVKRNHSEDKVVPLPNELPRWNKGIFTLPILALILLLGVNTNKVMSIWYANLGAVQMSQAELKNFPTSQWVTAKTVSDLEPAESTLRVALRYDPENQTANYRLGLISMLRQDFKSAAANLGTAYQKTPNHRGVIKNLGYAYVWLGEFDKAQVLLRHIPEAQDELSVYIWWWGTQGRPDLSERASMMVSQMKTSSQ